MRHPSIGLRPLQSSCSQGRCRHLAALDAPRRYVFGELKVGELMGSNHRPPACEAAPPYGPLILLPDWRAFLTGHSKNYGAVGPLLPENFARLCKRGRPCLPRERDARYSSNEDTSHRSSSSSTSPPTPRAHSQANLRLVERDQRHRRNLSLVIERHLRRALQFDVVPLGYLARL